MADDFAFFVFFKGVFPQFLGGSCFFSDNLIFVFLMSSLGCFPRFLG